ncbi:MAG: DNA polymerase III subunit beta [Richelia sp. RM1_1_1]|nr:DNA polymerase III subunit beta [Richelia sp. RM1_1_1]
MKVTINQSILNTAIESAMLAISSKPITAIVGCIIIEANDEDNTLTIKSTNINFSIYQIIDAEVSEKGQVAVSSQSFKKIIASLNGELYLSVEDSYLTISHETGQCRLIINENIQEFPDIETNLGECSTISISAKKLKTVLDSVLYAASRDESRMIITGTNFYLDAINLEAAATDGHRMARVQIPLDASRMGDAIVFTVPANILAEINKILSTTSENIDCIIDIYDNLVAITLPGIKIFSRLLDGEYPLISKLIPKAFEREFTIERKSFIDTLKRVLNIADKNDKAVAISWNIKTRKAIIFTESDSIGDAYDEIPMKPQTNSAEDFSIGFNIDYLIQAVENTTTDEIIVKCNEPTQPVLICPVGSLLDQLSLVMPLQIKMSEPKLEPKANEKDDVAPKEKISKPKKTRSLKQTVAA